MPEIDNKSPLVEELEQKIEKLDDHIFDLEFERAKLRNQLEVLKNE